MQVNDHVNVRAFWGGRVEPIQTQARMVWDCWQRLAARGGFLSSPWISLNIKPAGQDKVGSFETLLDHMSQACAKEGPYYGFCQDVDSEVPQPSCYASLNTDLSLPKIYGGRFSNSAILTLEQIHRSATNDGLPLAWLLSMSVALVRDFVDIWRPDFVDMNTTSLISQFPIRPGRPSIGFVTWLAPWVVEARKLPRTPIRQEYLGGTLIGIKLDAKDPVGEAAKLARKIYAADILKPLPTVQPPWGEAPSR